MILGLGPDKRGYRPHGVLVWYFSGKATTQELEPQGREHLRVAHRERTFLSISRPPVSCWVEQEFRSSSGSMLIGGWQHTGGHIYA